jgi:hypothetical protein
MFADLTSVLRIFLGEFQEPLDVLLVIVVFLTWKRKRDIRYAENSMT